ncbi:uncharacterized protein ASCRUDRAFT_76693 [Ascoidea rubescens DSM 1968]|uniref:Uncharacterized protein n=1 Tax=Ascoidea rubescens DSM 1968 TaxID=1344418 RepID=A0A1D2VFE8_9ASCO|nr:hypothetical protein ASCRUDRAFT_76693 [Ascoidea rubescens DSM 1968]ODV60197.1 hypothetical protein ASCRUDRAFT_76693 [Ascoidea rubescens DSM 1968]
MKSQLLLLGLLSFAGLSLGVLNEKRDSDLTGYLESYISSFCSSNLCNGVITGYESSTCTGYNESEVQQALECLCGLSETNEFWKAFYQCATCSSKIDTSNLGQLKGIYCDGFEAYFATTTFDASTLEMVATVSSSVELTKASTLSSGSATEDSALKSASEPESLDSSTISSSVSNLLNDTESNQSSGSKSESENAGFDYKKRTSSISFLVLYFLSFLLSLI